MAELVEHDHEDDAGDEDQRRAAAGHEDRERGHGGEETSRMPVATRLLTSAPTPASSSGSFMRRFLSRGSVQSLDHDGRRARAPPGHFENVGDVVNVPRALFEGIGILPLLSGVRP